MTSALQPDKEIAKRGHDYSDAEYLRAIAKRDQVKVRAAFEKARLAALKGDPEAFKQLVRNWMPLSNAPPYDESEA